MSASVVLLWVSGGLLLAAGVLLLASRLPAMVEAWRATRWHRTPATLQAMVLQRVGRGERYRVLVSYRYRHGDGSYVGHRIHPCYAASGKRVLHKGVLNRLQAGSVIAVHVHPDQPQRSTILVGVNRHCLLHALAGLPLVLIGLLVMGMALGQTLPWSWPAWSQPAAAAVLGASLLVAVFSLRARERLVADVARVL
ncbi:DUF3592 domain-containing protein [Caldimonas thermodepolymerans]|jgi:Protein of unknown function (DUF3592).|uniref:Uncharacterized protein DUF3592 n=1 Tax=Caldimonas thermodepolymerans TaxID=215580 RepID=A0AA46DEL2_9BURK|nr:DUF3592 domain-containing protein [Caldimonas thermodepolymerans]TCP07275.1 uncharacterized protein DUF3592 [Caldimonas thermodepolymerans]UZG42824.1 DUF3592 domain-containing protein [Caldimonas thermodepolymerans]UZG46489.1 DUF3592 domain-containing protein [Caldimonas thermodepolymerans]